MTAKSPDSRRPELTEAPAGAQSSHASHPGSPDIRPLLGGHHAIAVPFFEQRFRSALRLVHRDQGRYSLRFRSKPLDQANEYLMAEFANRSRVLAVAAALGRQVVASSISSGFLFAETRHTSDSLRLVGRCRFMACTLHFRAHFLRNVGSLTGCFRYGCGGVRQRGIWRQVRHLCLARPSILKLRCSTGRFRCGCSGVWHGGIRRQVRHPTLSRPSILKVRCSVTCYRCGCTTAIWCGCVRFGQGHNRWFVRRCALKSRRSARLLILLRRLCLSQCHAGADDNGRGNHKN